MTDAVMLGLITETVFSCESGRISALLTSCGSTKVGHYSSFLVFVVTSRGSAAAGLVWFVVCRSHRLPAERVSAAGLFGVLVGTVLSTISRGRNFFVTHWEEPCAGIA